GENGDVDGADGDSDAGDDGVDGENDGGDAESADGGGENGDTADAEDDTPEALAQKLREEHGGLDYAAQAAMLVARLAVERGDLAAARGHLRWVADNAAKPATGHAARVRLGRLLLAEGDVDGAAAVAAVEDEGGFVSHYAELRGDIFAARENFTEARAAYQRALAALPLGSAYRDLLELKINNSAGPAQ
ncbi:MAG: tetratricopeptide repeat protein, partial [Gammaproteobacteria bacterium]|nr:tetratricopeptide repeat protein [Gammaproteobacteria bacterium]